VLRHVQLPFLIPSFVAVLILRTADTLKLFDMVFTLTRGGPGAATEFIAILIERTGNRQFDIGMASTQAIILLVITVDPRPALHPLLLPGGPLMRRSLWAEGLLLAAILAFCVFPVLLDGDDQPEDAGRRPPVPAGLDLHADAPELLGRALRRPGRPG
jgi:hypothetical protein